MAHKLGNLDATVNLAYHYYTMQNVSGASSSPDQQLSTSLTGVDNLKAAKALLKHAYRAGKKDAVEYLISFDLIKDVEALSTEIVTSQDENGADLDLQILAAIDAVPV